MPEAPFHAFDVTPGQFAKMGIGGARADASGNPQDMLEAHGDMKPIQHDRRRGQYGALEVPQTGIAIRQYGRGRPAPYARSDQGTSEVFGGPAIAGKGETSQDSSVLSAADCRL